MASLVSSKSLREKLIKLDVHMDAANKDSILLAIRHWIVEIGELDSSFRKDVSRLKGFLTNDRDKVRVPYDRKESSYQRRTVFCATVNASDFLIDSTGNTRFWTIPCVKIDYDHIIDMQQVWAQLHHEFNSSLEDNQWWLTQGEERRLEHFNQSHRVVSAVNDLLSTRLDFDADKVKWTNFSAGQLLMHLGIDKPTNAQSREAGSYLREELGEPKKIRGYMAWSVPPLKSDSNFGKTYSQPKVSDDYGEY